MRGWLLASVILSGCVTRPLSGDNVGGVVDGVDAAPATSADASVAGNQDLAMAPSNPATQPSTADLGGCPAVAMAPKMPCVTNGKDPETGSQWTLCKASCDVAWISQYDPSPNARFHALQICQSLGYSKLQAQGDSGGGICGSVSDPDRGTCTMAGTFTFVGDKLCGNDAFGPILCAFTQWACAR